jgi:hypothetical protein
MADVVVVVVVVVVGSWLVPLGPIKYQGWPRAGPGAQQNPKKNKAEPVGCFYRYVGLRFFAYFLFL